VGLATLLGLDELPAEIAGWGIVPASVARDVAERQRAGEWRFAVLGRGGTLLFDGTTRARPASAGGPDRGSVRGGIVELHVPAALLDEPELVHRHPDWARLLTDLARQWRAQRPIEQDPAARFAGRRLRRRRQTLVQRCLFPGCRRPATDCDLDHHHEHARGGRTVDVNLGPACRHDHGLKTDRGWRLVRRSERRYLWISPLGRTHHVAVDPVAPVLPAPQPRERATVPETVDDIRDGGFDPAPTFQPVDRRGRPIRSTASPIGELAVAHDLDPPPF
jgi:hypothetical protein